MSVPTEQQSHALKAFSTGRPLKINAFAGSGKTTTLRLLAASRTARGAYLAFNRSIAREAAEKFPRTTDCRTTHSIAWRSVQSAHRFSTAKMNDRLYARQVAEELKLADCTYQRKLRLSGIHQAHLLLRTLRNFCQSSDPDIGRAHIPQYGRLVGAGEAIVSEVHAWVLTNLRALWERMVDRRDPMSLGHDGYLKLWALGRPKLGYEYILLDEAQDTNPVVLGVLADQEAQIVYVGDKHQQIYEWRGAINAMEKIRDCEESSLTQSFRFGTAIAEAASQVLRTLGETEILQGNPAVSSTITANGQAKAVLARTNATVLLEVLDALNANLRPCVVGGTSDLKRLLKDVFELKAGNPGASPEFFGLANWEEVVAFSETEEGEDLRTFVQLVEQHGERKLWAAVSRAQEKEDGADVVLSTVHKAKGREWDSVRLAPDFVSSRLDGGHPDSEAEVRLFYVAMTRAKRNLSVDPNMLATFTSGAWKARKPETGRGPRAESTARPKPPPPPPKPTSPAPARVPEQTPVGQRPQAPSAQPPPPVSVTPALDTKAPSPHRTLPVSSGSNVETKRPSPPPLPTSVHQIPAETVPKRERRWWKFWG